MNFDPMRAPQESLKLLTAAESMEPRLRDRLLPKIVADYQSIRSMDLSILLDPAFGSAAKHVVESDFNATADLIRSELRGKDLKDDREGLLEGVKESVNSCLRWIDVTTEGLRSSPDSYSILAYQLAFTSVTEEFLTRNIPDSLGALLLQELEIASASTVIPLVFEEMTIRHMLNDWQVKHQIFLEPKAKEILVSSMLKNGLFTELLAVGPQLPPELPNPEIEGAISKSIKTTGTLSPAHVESLLKKALQRQNRKNKGYEELEPAETNTKPNEEIKPTPAETLKAHLVEFFEAQYPGSELPMPKLEKLAKFFESHWGGTIPPSEIMRELTFALLRPFNEDPTTAVEQLFDHLRQKYRKGS